MEHLISCIYARRGNAGLVLGCLKTLYLRNAPADVIERLERLAERENASVSAAAIRELAAATRRVDNPELLADLPDLNIDTEKMVNDIDVERAGR